MRSGPYIVQCKSFGLPFFVNATSRDLEVDSETNRSELRTSPPISHQSASLPDPTDDLPRILDLEVNSDESIEQHVQAGGTAPRGSQA